MPGNATLLDEVRNVFSPETGIPALRIVVFLFGVMAALAWLRRRPRLGLVFVSTGAFLALGYWLIQITPPFGFGTDPVLARQWAQSRVSAFAEPKGAAFVWGASPEFSLLAAMASAGIPYDIVLLSPQIAAVLFLALLILLPQGLIKSPTSAALAAALAVGGGIWPGVLPYGSLLLRPALLVAALGAGSLAMVLGHWQVVRRWFRRSRLAILPALMVAAAFCAAFQGGKESSAATALLLGSTAMILASPLRAALRKTSPSLRAARRSEALLILATFSGSGLLWWNPAETVAGYAESTDTGFTLRRPMEWITEHVPPAEVVLATPAYSVPIAALAGRRVLFPPPQQGGPNITLSEPFRRGRLLESTLSGRPIARLAEGFSVTHIFLGPGEATPPHGEEGVADREERLRLILVYEDTEDFRVFRLAKK